MSDRYLFIGDPYFLSKSVATFLGADKKDVMFYDSSIRPHTGLDDIGEIVISSVDSDYGLKAALTRFKPTVVFYFPEISLDFSNKYDPIRDYRYFMSGVYVLSEALSSFHIDHLYLRSSFEIYGISPRQKTGLRESDSCNPISFRGSCVRAAEDYLKLFCFERKIRFTSLRFFDIYGNEPAEYPRGFLQSVIKGVVDGMAVGVSGWDTYRDFISLSDASSVVANIVRDSTKIGPINIASGCPVKISRLVKAVRKHFHENCSIINIKQSAFPAVSAVASAAALMSALSVQKQDVLESIPTIASFYAENFNNAE